MDNTNEPRWGVVGKQVIESKFNRSFLLVPAQAIVGGFLKSFEEFPPRQKPASFSVGDALSHLETASQGK